jgi:hypothetical protein
MNKYNKYVYALKDIAVIRSTTSSLKNVQCRLSSATHI